MVAVADNSKYALRRAKESGVQTTFLIYDDLLKEETIDAVIINLPNHLHLDSSIKAAEAGKAILLEKPIAGNLKDGKQIFASIKKNGVKLMMGYPLRFHPGYSSLKSKIDDGYFGEIEVVTSQNISNGPFTSKADSAGPVAVPSWWFDKNLVGGGALLDLGIHMINLLIWYFGEVEVLSTYLGNALSMNIEDTATCALRFRNGPLATINSGWFSKDYVNCVNIYGTSKAYTYSISGQSRRKFVQNDIRRLIYHDITSPTYFELKYFIECIQKDINPEPSVDDGLYDLATVTVAYEKAAALQERTLGDQ